MMGEATNKSKLEQILFSNDESESFASQRSKKFQKVKSARKFLATNLDEKKLKIEQKHGMKPTK